MQSLVYLTKKTDLAIWSFSLEVFFDSKAIFDGATRLGHRFLGFMAWLPG
jgi:hypothetical protein